MSLTGVLNFAPSEALPAAVYEHIEAQATPLIATYSCQRPFADSKKCGHTLHWPSVARNTCHYTPECPCHGRVILNFSSPSEAPPATADGHIEVEARPLIATYSCQ